MSQNEPFTLNTDVLGSVAEQAARISVEGANPFLSQHPERIQRQNEAASEQSSNQVGKFDNVPNDQKPLPERITAGLTGCVVQELPEELRERYVKWYGPSLHCCARGSIANDRYNRFRDGSPIRTSLIVRDVQHEDGSRFLYTLNSCYEVLS